MAKASTDAKGGSVGTGPSAPDQAARRTLTKSRSSVVTSITDAVVAKGGEPFLVCKPNGQIPDGPGDGYGFYHHDCRFLRGYEMRIGGVQPESLASAEMGPSTLLLELTNPAIHSGGETIERDQLALRWTRRVDGDGPTLHDEIEIRNFAADDAHLPMDLRFMAEFEDVFEVRGLSGKHGGKRHDPAWHGSTLQFRYDGSDDVERGVDVRLNPVPDAHDDTGATINVTVPGRGRTTLRVDIRLTEHTRNKAKPVEERGSPDDKRPRHTPVRREMIGEETADTGWIGGNGWRTQVRTSSFALRRVLGRSLDDLAQLRGRLDDLEYYEAGIPWFATLFGRDSLISALQTLAFNADGAAETLRLLARKQGTKDDAWREEAPGRILHELRIGELARTNQIPQTPYYGTIDATPLFLLLLAEHATWTGSLDLYRELRGAVEGALGWMNRTAAGDDDGFLSYTGRGKNGLVNQGWKDSGDAIVNADGSLADPPIALVEVQGYAFRAQLAIADLMERDGDQPRARALRESARELQQRFEDRMWSERLGCYVLALGKGEPCEVVTSNAGQALWTGIVREDRAARVAERLMKPDMFAGWGIRTLSADATGYQPIGYHRGTIWPHDNSLIAAGFRRYGHDGATERIFLGLLETAGHMPADRLPECFAGFAQDRFSVPVRYPVACHPQAWAAGAMPSLLITTLGIEPDGFDHVLRVRRPQLPEGIEQVELKDLPVGGGSAHLRFVRSDGHTHLDVIGHSGGVKVEYVEEPAARESTSSRVKDDKAPAEAAD